MFSDEKTWFLCYDEYNGVSESAFKWNEFEETEIIASSFYEFLDMVMKGTIII